MILFTVIFILTIISTMFAIKKSWTLLVNLVLICGLLQVPLVSILENNSFQFIDDVPAVVLILTSLVYSLNRRTDLDRIASSLLIVLILILIIQTLRSPDLTVALAQARQVILPFGIVYTGAVLRHELEWEAIWRTVLVLGLITAAWVIYEEVRKQPLIDPVWYYLETIGASPASLRHGLPPSYYADAADGKVIFRPGGPFMNPPVTGFMLGSASYAVSKMTSGFLRVLFLVTVGTALLFSYSRAGMVIFVVVVAVFLIWAHLGRFAGWLVALMASVFAVETFLHQGNTASHVNGLISGTSAGIESIYGLGFGTTGYRASLQGVEVGDGAESLLGLYFAWLGIPMIATICWLGVMLLRRLQKIPRKQSRELWFAISILVTAAVSESASSLASTVPLWITLGLQLGSMEDENVISDSAR